MKSLHSKISFAALATIVSASYATDAAAVSRSEAVSRAKGFAFHPFSVAPANQTASCNPTYVSAYPPGDYVGLPYDWGGYMTLFQFDQGIAAGLGAGSYPEDGILDCTVGLDCSGFLSKVWQLGHFTTSSFHQVTTAINANQLLPGDGINDAGYHCAMFEMMLGNGEPAFIESVAYNVHTNVTGGWSYANQFTPIRRDGITGTTASDPLGTLPNPIKVSSFPYTDTRNTAQSLSDMLDGCGADPTKNESGPEYVYEMTFAQPGTLTVSVSDDVGVDIDVHVYTSQNTSDCFARDDATVTVNVDCGTYLVVADTFKGASEYPGAYTLSASFTPSGQGCGNGPPGYSPSGELGDPCGYPGDPSLPFCNPNLGAQTCLYSSTDSFCSKPCAVNGDCAMDFPGGCCLDIGQGEQFCMTANFCAGGEVPEPGDTPEPGDPGEVPNPGGPGSTENPDGTGTSTGEAPAPGDPGANGSSAGASSSDADDDGGCSIGPQRRSSPAPVSSLLLGGLALGLALRRRRSARLR